MSEQNNNQHNDANLNYNYLNYNNEHPNPTHEQSQEQNQNESFNSQNQQYNRRNFDSRGSYRPAPPDQFVNYNNNHINNSSRSNQPIEENFQYESFVNNNPSEPIRTSTGVINDVFVENENSVIPTHSSNDMRIDTNMHSFTNPNPVLKVNTSSNANLNHGFPNRIPSINLIQNSEVIPQSPQAYQNLEMQRFNDEEYYHQNHNITNTDHMDTTYDHYTPNFLRPNNLQDNLSIENNTHQMETAPIFNYNTQYAYPGSNNNQGFENFNNNKTTESFGDDSEHFYVDQNGDDYEIYTYLDNNGDMVDPYNKNNSHLDTQDERYLSPYNNSGTNNNSIADIADRYSHINLGEYGTVEDDYSINNKEGTTLNVNKMESNSSASNIEVDYVNPLSSKFEDARSRDNLLDENDVENNRLIRRNTTVIKKFKLLRGNFIFDCPISSTLLNKYSTVVGGEGKLSNEFKFMRYQAITCEPLDMDSNDFRVRQLQYAIPRQTELMIVITMYNEDHILLGRTLKGAMENIRHMVKKKRSSTWGPDAWKKIVICVVSDGRSKINEKSLALLSTLGCYQDGFAKEEVNDKKVKMHLYEHTTMMNIKDVTETGLEIVCDSSTVPVQLLFCLKEENQKKINSHRWAFEGFANMMRPNIVTLLDAGTMPGKDSIYELWSEFKNPQVGGACGEIKTEIGKLGKSLINPLVASQNFEYKMSNILDKTTESNFGFITVLPGAFSAYRLSAIEGEPLTKYFYGESMESEVDKLNFFSSNMYLAEDRILCFEIVTKKGCNWILKYCRSSYASTDVPTRVPEFILQRRRWLNGSFFASVYSFYHFYKIWTSGHSIIRKIVLNLEFLYLFFNTLMSWFSLSSFFLVFRILTLSTAITYHSAFNILSVIFFWLYGICVMSTFILSLGNKPKSTEIFYVITCIFFAVLMVYMLFCSIFLSVKAIQEIVDQHTVTFKSLFSQSNFRDICISLASTYVLYFVSSIIYLQPWHMITSFVQYLLLSPSYINVLNIYAFCNVHDISWGTKGAVAKQLGKITTKDDGTFKMEILVSSEEIQNDYNRQLNILNATAPDQEESSTTFSEKKTGYYANIRSLVIIFWVLTNFGVVAAVLKTGGINDYLLLNKLDSSPDNAVTSKTILSNNATWYLGVILWLVALTALIRFIGCCFYMVSRLF